jgi:hypothetical protein
MLYLIHENFQGEPLGIWNETGGSYYLPNNAALQQSGNVVVQGRNPQVPWVSWVGEREQAVNHNSWWESYQTVAPMQQALSDFRDQYFSQQNAEGAEGDSGPFKVTVTGSTEDS